MIDPITSPFAGAQSQADGDKNLVAQALDGDRGALETLCTRHQPWIYNIAFRMVLSPPDAEDITQEVLIKMITKLATYDPDKAAFRTWLYRIVANHVINLKAGKSGAQAIPFETYYGALSAAPDEPMADTPEMRMVVEDLKVGCLTGVLLCLDPRQRLVFILSVVFDAPSELGSEIVGVSRDNYRQILSRARSQLHEYMSGNCGVINEKATCHCRNKVTGFLKAGAMSSDRITFARPDGRRVREVLAHKEERFGQEVFPEITALLREHPFYDAPDAGKWLRELLEKPEFKDIFQFN